LTDDYLATDPWCGYQPQPQVMAAAESA